MILKDFIETYGVQGFEIIEDVQILSIVTGDATYGLSVDTSNIPVGMSTTIVTDFTIDDNILEVEGLTLDIETTTLL